jgi:glycerol kinase
MEADAGTAIQELRVDGGATVNDTLMQIQANVLGANVVRPQITETTAMGAAYLAGLAVGFWKDLAEIQQQWKVQAIFKPCQQQDITKLVKGWQKAVKACEAWAELQES